MSRWSDEFENHPIHQRLIQLGEYLAIEVENTDAEFEDERRRLRDVLANLREIVAGLTTEFVPVSLLNQINKHLSHQNFYHQLQEYSSSPDVSQLRVANDHVTQYAPQIFQLAAMSRPIESQEAVANAQKAFNSFAASMDRNASQTNERFDEHEVGLANIMEKAESISETITGLDASSTEKLAGWQEDFTEKQTARAREHAAAQVERENIFKEAIAQWKSTLDAQQADITTKQNDALQATLDHFKETGKAVLMDVSEKHEEVKEIHKLVGRDSVAGGYQTTAGDERKQANLWRIVSLLCVAGTVIWLAIKYNSGFIPMTDGSINWPDVVTASSLTAILIYAAGYTSSQSKMHRDNEKLWRSYALETKALDPFIASLEKSEQQAIKAELVRRMFGQQNTLDHEKRIKLDDGSLKTLLDRFSTTVTDAANKIAGKN